MPAIKREFKTSLHVLSYKQNDRCIAHCLEFDLIGEGTTDKEARENLNDLIFNYLQFALKNNIAQFAYHPAPKIYWNKFEELYKENLARQSIDPELLKAPKNRIKDFIKEEKVDKVFTHA